MYLFAAIVGLLLVIAGVIISRTLKSETYDRQNNEVVIRPHPARHAILGVMSMIGFVIMGYSIFNGIYFYAEPGYKYHVRTILGQERVVDGVGYQVHLFGRRNAWKKAMTVQAVSSESYSAEGNTGNAENEGDDTSASLPPQTILFLDQVDARAQATARFRLPSDPEKFLHLVHEYRTPSNLMTTSLIPAFRETIQATGSLMSAEEYYSGARTEFNTEFENQMQNGVYIVRRREEIVNDPNFVAPGSANAAKGTNQDAFGDEKRVVFKVSKILGSDGQPLRKSQKYTSFGISVVDARVTEMVPNDKFVERMQLKQKASADRAINREQRVQEEERKLLEIAKGEREVAERQAKAKVEQIERTTQAETEKQLALTNANKLKEQAKIDQETSAINLEKAKIDAEAKRVTADAAAYEKKAIIEADNALQQKLDAYVKAQEVWADAFARRQVPRQVFGSTGTGGSGTDMDVQAFMQILTAKAAQDLSFSPGIERASPNARP